MKTDGYNSLSETNSPAEMEPRSRRVLAGVDGEREFERNFQPGTGSSTTGACDLDLSESPADCASGSGPDNYQLMVSLGCLCSEVKEQLCDLREADFEDVEYYHTLRQFFHLDDQHQRQPRENPLA